MNTKRSWTPRLLLLLALMMSLNAVAHAQTSSGQVTAIWTGAGNSTNWSDPANWSTPNFPNNGTPAGMTYKVVIDGNSAATANVVLNVTVAIDALTVNSGDSLAFNNAQKLTIVNRGAGTNSGTVTNSGVIALNSAGNVTDLVINGDVTLNGGGTLTLSNNSQNRIYGAATTDRLTNVDNAIQGAGQIGVDSMALTNQGTVRANQSNPLTIDPSASGVSNSGTLEASGGILRLQDGSFTNTGVTAIIIARDTSFVDLAGATITGPTLSTVGSGAIRNVSTATLSNLTNAGNFAANNATVTNLVGTITNSGVIALNSVGNVTDLVINGDVTLIGGGSVTLSDNFQNRIYGTAAANRLTNAAGHTIQGAGQIGVDSMALTNVGNIIANQSNTLTIDPAGDGVSNGGTLEASSATLRLQNGAFTNTGNGLILARAASFVDLAGATITGPTLSAVGSGAIRNVSTATLSNLTNAGNFAANNATTTNLVGTITNSGVIALNSAGNVTDLVINGDVTLTGGGSVTLSNNPQNRIYGAVRTDRLTNVNNMIQGAGQIGVDFMALTNQGTVRANQSNPLIIDPSASGVINSGTLEASGGILRLQNGSFTNTSFIVARNASVVELSGAAVSGGTLATDSTSVIRNVGTSTLSNLTNAGNFAANNATTTNLVGTITNTGTIVLNSAGNVTNLVINGDVTLNGGGTLTLSNNSQNRIYGAVSTNRLTNVSNTIQGAGQIGANFMALTNTGTIRANQSNPLIIDTSAVNGFTTSGTVQVLAGSTLMMNGDNFNQTAGVTSVNGTLRVDNATVIIQGGVLQGNGTIKGNVINAGTVSPGTSPGMLLIDGNYTQTAAGTLLIEIGGPVPNSQYDQLVVTGAANLAGTLSVNIINGYAPPRGTSFQFLTSGSVNGTLILRVMGPGNFAQDYNPNDGTLISMGGGSNLGPNDDAYNLVLGPPDQAQQAGVVLQANGIFVIRAPGVLANDDLTPGAKIQLRVVANSKNGRFQLRGDGTLYYLPSTGKVGVDELNYTVSDGIKTVTARVLLNVTDRREPELRVDTPRDRSTLPAVTQIAGRVRDRNSGLKSLTLSWLRFDGKSWNGSAWTAAASELPLSVNGINWVYNGPLPKPGNKADTDLIDGRYDLRVTATDNSGNSIQNTNRITVSAPQVPSTVRLSAVDVAAAQGTIALNFTGALDAAVAKDKSHYSVTVKGAPVAVNAVSYAGNTVTLSGFNFAPGDSISLQISGLRDTVGNTLSGVVITLVAA